MAASALALPVSHGAARSPALRQVWPGVLEAVNLHRLQTSPGAGLRRRQSGSPAGQQAAMVAAGA